MLHGRSKQKVNVGQRQQMQKFNKTFWGGSDGGNEIDEEWVYKYNVWCYDSYVHAFN